MEGLQFPYRQLIQETEALRRMAADILVSDGPLRDLAEDLKRISVKSAERDRKLELRPLHTQPTRNYEPSSGSRSGGHEVYARIRGVWQIRPVGRTRPRHNVAFTGSASAVVELWPADCLYREAHEELRRLAMWRVELGAHDSPGCYFHIQILGDHRDPPFPKSIPIPRLPSPFVTPMAAVEFAFGELFQNEWQRRTMGTRNHHSDWWAIQHQRWSALLKWQRSALEKGGASPWMNLKGAKPPADMFLRN